MDPFLDSGQVALNSKIMKCRYIGFEIVEDYYKLAKKRLENNIYRINGEARKKRSPNKKHISPG